MGSWLIEKEAEIFEVVIRRKLDPHLFTCVDFKQLIGMNNYGVILLYLNTMKNNYFNIT